MLSIGFTFTANRFHTTPWGRHVNEGAPEWPPSPWRILRALVSVWMRTMPEAPQDRVVPILECLASELPSYYLPPATPAHSRHYMPYYEGATATTEKRTQVLDSFVAMQPGEPLVAFWPDVELAREEQRLLKQMLGNLGYLGRAESWCDAYLTDAPSRVNCYPLERSVQSPGDTEIVRVLAPKPLLRLKDLCVETADLRGQGHIDPPGARWVQYVRPADSFRGHGGQARRRTDAIRPTVFRCALAGNVLPLITDALPLAELMRASAMAHYGGHNGGGASEILSGKDAHDNFLKRHEHAFYLPTDEDEDGYLDHITVWAPGGLAPEELDALARVRCLKPGGGRPGIRTAFLGYGYPADFGKEVSFLGQSRTWETLIPFVLNRHPKWRGPKGAKRLIDGPEEQVQTEIERRPHLPSEVESVEIIGPPRIRGWRPIQPLEFYRWRRKTPPSGGAYYIRLRFQGPINGPLALGYGCHFGLGLFTPAPDAQGG